MGELVVLRKGVPVTNSKIIAKESANSHPTIQKLIKTHFISLEKFGRVGFEIVPLKTKGGLQNVNIYYLNEQQTTLLVTFMKNNEKVINLKIKLVKDFFKMKNFIEEKQSQEWKEAREMSKSHTKEFNDVINLFVEYATASGSSKPKMYFIHFARLVNKTMGIKDGQRDLTVGKGLRNQTFIMEFVEGMIKDGINNGIYYKDVYENCKAKLEEVLNVMPMLRLG